LPEVDEQVSRHLWRSGRKPTGTNEIELARRRFSCTQRLVSP
jgi:hypothetical protein